MAGKGRTALLRVLGAGVARFRLYLTTSRAIVWRARAGALPLGAGRVWPVKPRGLPVVGAYYRAMMVGIGGVIAQLLVGVGVLIGNTTAVKRVVLPCGVTVYANKVDVVVGAIAVGKVVVPPVGVHVVKNRVDDGHTRAKSNPCSHHLPKRRWAIQGWRLPK